MAHEAGAPPACAADDRRRGADVERREGPVVLLHHRHDPGLRRIDRCRSSSADAWPAPWPTSPACGSGSSPRLGRLAPPVWRTDPEFELDYHVREVSLPPPAIAASCWSWPPACCRTPSTAPDRCGSSGSSTAEDAGRRRPLGQGRRGSQGGRRASAMIIKLHHTITDGQGGVRLAERYMDLTGTGSPPPEVDLDAIVAAAVAEERARERAHARSAGPRLGSGADGRPQRPPAARHRPAAGGRDRPHDGRPGSRPRAGSSG